MIASGTVLTVIGCRAGMPSPGQPSSGYLLRTSGANVLLDCGPGVSGSLSAFIDPSALEAVIVTHMHTDHCYDLLPLGKLLLGPGLPAARPRDRSRPELYVPGGAGQALRALNALFPIGASSTVLDRVFDEAFATIEYRPGDRFAVGDCDVTLIPTSHAVPCCGVRIDTAAGSVAYSGDSGYTDDLVELARDTDLFVCEASLREPDGSGHGHLSAGEAGTLAHASGTRHLLLTHFSDARAERLTALKGDAAEHFAGRISVARPGLRIDLLPTPLPDEDLPC